MSQNRTIPFGYKMEHAKIVPNETEADTVNQIFSLYLEGNSLRCISERMEAYGAHYHDETCVWNKNMIKRILENERYIGTSDYPRIVDDKTYLAVQCLIQEKQSQRKPRLESLKEIGNKIVCSECGMMMQRHTKASVVRWDCVNKECSKSITMPDEVLRAKLDHCITQLAMSPALLAPCAHDEQQVSPDVLRLKNELTAAFNRGTESPEYMRSLIFALAAEQYNALPDMSLIHTLKELQDRIAAEGITEDNRREIEQKVVRRILLGRESGVSIELINGKIISSKEEAEQ